MSLMIVRAERDQFILVEQHHHALQAGVMAQQWKEFPYGKQFRSLVGLATSLHDIGWQPLDHTPMWNMPHKRPYSFVDYPLAPKLDAYKAGVDFVESLDPLAALICSMHYLSFFSSPSNGDDQITEEMFVKHEQSRQKRLSNFLKEVKPTLLEVRVNALEYLQFFDNLSLYLCLNQVGASKDEEHPWFRDGLTLRTTKGEQQQFNLFWTGNNVIIDPFPFIYPFFIFLQQKILPNTTPDPTRFSRQYQQAPFETMVVKIRPRKIS